MSHKNKKSLKRQSFKRMQPMLCLGRSKHEDKRTAAKEYERRYGELIRRGIKPPITKQEYVNDAIRGHIYSVSTWKTYVKHVNYFLDYCKTEHRCKTIDQCYPYAFEWLQNRSDSHLSAWTCKLEAAALAKLYGVPARDFGATPARRRENIKRSRGTAVRDADLSYTNNEEITQFCRSTGLRRSEIGALTPEQLEFIDELPHLQVKGKGGRVRHAPIAGNVDRVIRKIKETQPGQRVWDSIPSHLDVHACRAEYACSLYRQLARDVSTLPREQRYYCRTDRKGIVYDRGAMMRVSNALGHSRLSVVAGHYLYRL